jgi:sulfatase maturation enzyme AslB (radical SAM superfamily)
VVDQNSLILTLTRQCNLRCSYCPTAKDGWPVLSKTATDRGVDLFLSIYGGGDIKLFGGEPLLEPDLVRHVLETVRENDKIRWIYLSTNGLGLTKEWLSYLCDYPKAIVTISMDGLAENHRKLRRALPGTPDSYDHVVSLLPDLLKVPRLVITQTIAPSMAKSSYENFQHLRHLGFKRFNFLPGYFIPWKNQQLEELRTNFMLIQQEIQDAWLDNHYLYIRNLFVRAPTPFFNQGMIVDSDETIHPSNVGLSGALDHLRKQTQVGSLSVPPTLESLNEKSLKINKIIKSSVSEKIWNSTLSADAELTRLCHNLMPSFLMYRKNKGSAA